MLTEKKNLLLFFILSVCISIASLIKGVPFLFGLSVIIFTAGICYSLTDLRNRAALFIFLMSFFIFLIGGEMTKLYFGMDFGPDFGREIDGHTYLCLLISLTGILAGFFCAEYIIMRSKLPDGISASSDSARILVQRVALAGVYITFVPAVIKALDAGKYVAENGYASLYSTYKTTLPTVIITLAQLFTMLVFIYFATMPRKKNCIIPLILYFSYGALGLLSGRRLLLGTTLLVIIFYFIVRSKLTPDENWLDRKKVAFLIIVVACLMVFLYAYKYIRYGQNIEKTGVFSMFMSFFNQQGESINVIKYQKQLEGDQLKFTSFYYTIGYFRRSILTRGFSSFPRELYDLRTRATALYTNNLADYIIYKVNPDSYYAGYGYGTSYIAETYHDFGYTGVVIYSFILGCFLNKLYSFKKKYASVWRIAIALMILEEITVLPRYGADSVLQPFYNLTNMMVLIVLVLLYRWARMNRSFKDMVVSGTDTIPIAIDDVEDRKTVKEKRE